MSINTLQWVDKYRPKIVDDIIGNLSEIEIIDKWLSVFKNPSTATKSFKNGLLISGVPGIGKTTTAHVLLKKHGFDVIEFNASELRTSKEICEKLSNILSGKSIKTIFNNDCRTGVIMDEVDGIESKKEYSTGDIIDYINYSENEYNKLIKIENKNNKVSTSTSKKKKQPQVFFNSMKKDPDEYKKKRCYNGVWVNKNPIILICNVINKNITPILKNVVHVKFNPPSDYDIYILLKKINDSENMGFNDIILNLIVPQCQSDNRRATYIMEQLSLHIRDENYNIDKSKVNTNTILKLIKNMGSKDLDIEIFQAINNIFTRNDLTPNQILLNFESDNNYVPFIIHENFIPFIDKNTNNSYIEKINLCIDYYDNLIESQIYKNDFFGNWEFLDYIGYFSCVAPNYIIHHNAKLKDTLQYTNYEKSALISKYNYRFYNLKSINSISKKLFIDITNFQMFASILIHAVFVETSFLPKILEICASYNLTFKDIEKTLKLSLLFDNYEKTYTKKFQKTLNSSYSIYNIQEVDDSD